MVATSNTEAVSSPKRSLERARVCEEGLIAVVEVCKVGVNLEDPVRLHKHNSANVDATTKWPQKGPTLQPSDHVVQVPGYDEWDNSRG